MAISFVNSTCGTIGTAASTWSLAFPTGLTAGGAYVIGIGCNTGVTVNSVADANVSYTQIVRANAPSTSSAELWWVNNASTTGTRIQIGLSGASSGSIAIGHWIGISTARGLVASGSSAIGSNSTSHSGSEIIGPSSALFVAYARLTQSTIGSITLLDNMVTWATTNTAQRQLGVYRFGAPTNASTFTGAFTTSSNVQHAVAVAAFSDTTAYVPSGNWLLTGVQ